MPAAQLVQDDAPPREYLPVSQPVHVAAPAFEYMPLSHPEHVREPPVEYVPPAQLSQLAAPLPERFPGSHSTHSLAPEPDDLPAGVVNVTPRAGDVIVMTEMLAHGTLQWKPTDRQRRTLVLRYRPQYRNRRGAEIERVTVAPKAIQERLSPQVRELMDYAHYTDVKEITKEEVVRLT